MQYNTHTHKHIQKSPQTNIQRVWPQKFILLQYFAKKYILPIVFRSYNSQFTLSEKKNEIRNYKTRLINSINGSSMANFSGDFTENYFLKVVIYN